MAGRHPLSRGYRRLAGNCFDRSPAGHDDHGRAGRSGRQQDSDLQIQVRRRCDLPVPLGRRCLVVEVHLTEEYRKLAQGNHTFKVRAVKNGQADRTPASRVFTVDTVAPETTISDGPTGTSQERTPTFTFAAGESATFVCRLAGVVTDPCSSPFSPAEPLTDDNYTFRVTATDLAGNVDATPANRAFGVDTPLTMDQATAEQAAALYLPDTIDMDVPASCTDVDCPGGTSAPAADQLRSTSTRVVTLADAHTDPLNVKYAVTATSNVSTISDPIPVTLPLAGECGLTLTSASGALPTWDVVVPLQFTRDFTTNEREIQVGTPTVIGLEAADVSLTGNFACTLVSFGTGFAQDIYASTLLAHFDAVGWPMCAEPGPAYLGPCS